MKSTTSNTTPHTQSAETYDLLPIDSPALLESFIRECILIDSANPLSRAIHLTRYTLHRTDTLTQDRENTLKTLEKSLEEPISIAVVGQFSSGKSTFLNAIIGRAILPSGITPITSKVCTICYGDTYSLEVLYNDGRIATKPLDFIHTLDELENLQIREFILRVPNPILHSISLLDTPGFNSQNTIDTETTNMILSRVDGIIWLSLIDNVGKQSEKDIIEAHIKQYPSKSLCVLNQKDRLANDKEIQTSLNYAKVAFSGSFSDIIAISAKNALQAIQIAHQTQTPLESNNLYKQSNFQAVLEFITTLTTSAKELRSSTITRTLQKIATQSLTEIEQSLESINAYLRTLMQLDSTLRFNALQSRLEKRFNAFFARYDNALESLAQYIFSQLESKDFTLSITSKNILGIRTKELQTYQATIIPKDTLISKLHSEENRFLLDLRTLGLQISAFGKEFAKFLDNEFHTLSHNTNALTLEHIPSLNDPWLDLRHSIALSIKSENTAALCTLQSELDSLKTLLTLNYPNAIALTINTLDSSINYALHKHKQSPKDFALLTPTLENIRASLDNAMHFSIFQDKLSLHNALYKKTLWSLSQAYINGFAHASELVAPYSATLQKHMQIINDSIKYLHIDST